MQSGLLKIFAVMFVALLAVQSLLSIFVFDFQLKNHKRKFKWDTLLSLPDEKLTLVKVAKCLEDKPNQHFKRIHGKEFSFKGQMYDIVRKQELGDTTYYFCFHDHAENEIFQNINRWMHDNFGKQNDQSSKGKAFNDVFKQQYVSGRLEVFFQTRIVSSKLHHSAFAIHTRTLQVFVEPPETA